ncbi:MAG TPA: hypothetical protein VEO36_05290 [Casimicrobiaceae bacterium]|nr:hypothetical protein [Casimicrobiaceae bacterium]
MSGVARDHGLSRGEWIALAAAIVIAHLFYWRIVVYPSAFDAQNYFDIAADIDRNGLFSKFYYSDIRTYGYPLLLALLSRAANLSGISVGFLLFETQLTLYLLAAYGVRRELVGLWPALATWAFIGIVLNVFALSYTPESLTESVSLSLLLVATACWLALLAGPTTWRPVLAGSIAVGAAVMVRPANLFALATWTLAVAAVCFARRPTARALSTIIVALLVGVLLPMLPQYINNVRHYGKHTALVAAPLGYNQQIWGIPYLKYATALPPVPNPSIFYENPFASAGPVDEERPLAWYAKHPLSGALTLGLHIFNMLDQDLLFTYSRDLDPWYRIPLGILNHLLVATALLGIALLIVRARHDRLCALAAGAAILYIVSHIALHATTAVEMRFGLPLLLLAGPAALAAIRELAHARASRRVALASLAVVGYTTAALLLSDWVRQQAPSIRAWEAAHATALTESNGAILRSTMR